ncbi:MAG TPA: hypothetical protein PKE00_12870, partial [Planctomycetota bacterium]|nr:hypothetical protein [Planctomycetota bacterium]
ASIATARRLVDAPLAFDLLKTRVLQQARTGEDFVRAIDDLVRRAATHDGATRAWFTNEIWALAAPRFSAEEKLRLLTSLRPAIGRPTEDAALLAVYWGKIEASIHQQLGDDARCESLLRTMRAEHPFDVEVMTLHFASLLRLGRNEEVVRGWIDATRGTMWDDSELETVYVRCTDLLWSQRKHAELDAVLAAWTSRRQESQQAWSRWLSMQLFADRVDAADSWAAERLAAIPERLDEVSRSKLSVAIAHAYTTGWNYSSNRLTPEWSKRLFAAATQLLDRGETTLLRQITSPWQWRQRSDVAAMLRARMLELLVDRERITSMPINMLTLCLQNVEVAKGQLDPAQFTKIHDGLRSRWLGLMIKGNMAFDERTQVAQHLLSVCDARGEKEAAYAFAKERFEASIEVDNRRTCAADLLERTLALEEVQR